jgi:hypothetical protein
MQIFGQAFECCNMSVLTLSGKTINMKSTEGEH